MIEVPCAPPPYRVPEQPPTEAAPANPLPNLDNRPFGLPTGVRGQPGDPQGTTPESPPSEDLEITDAELAAAIIDALHPTIRFGDPRDERRGGGVLGSNQTPIAPPPTRANSSTGIHGSTRVLPWLPDH